MATYTEKLGLKLPAQTDFYNIDDFNENFRKIDGLAVLRGTTAPTTATVGIIGQFYFDTGAKMLYQCVSAEGGVYEWFNITLDSSIGLSPDVATALGLTGNPQVKDALMRVAPWRLLTIYDVAGAYVFDPADFPGVSEIGAFIIGAGGSGTAAVDNGGTPSMGGASGRTRAIIRKAPFLTTFNLVVGQGGVAVTTTTPGNHISGQDGGSSAFDGVTASGGKKGAFDTKESLVPAGGQAPFILTQGPSANVTRPPFAFGEVISTTMGYGGTARQNPMFPNECLNPFDGKRICIAGGSRYRNNNANSEYEESIAITDDYGNTGSVVAFSTSDNAIAIKGTSYGCGGGAALTTNTGGYMAKSAAGCDGAVLIYGR